jgi:hypothetical protein
MVVFNKNFEAKTLSLSLAKMPPIQFSELEKLDPKAARPFLQIIYQLYMEEKDPAGALQKDLAQAGNPISEIWKSRVWSFKSRITGTIHYLKAGKDVNDFEVTREAIEEAEEEELQDRRDEYDDDDRYCPFGSGRRYEPDDVYQ